MIRAIIILTLAVLTSCATNSNNQANSQTKQGGHAPITHEPYGSEMKQFSVHNSQHLTWKSGPPSLPAGAQITVLEGDPSKEGPFVFRLKFPDGYTIPPHRHPRAERLTVIQGTFNVAEGDNVDKSAAKSKLMPTGSFGYWPARMNHYAWATGETVVQLHGFGPWTLEYLNPADDPRNANRQ